MTLARAGFRPQTRAASKAWPSSTFSVTWILDLIPFPGRDAPQSATSGLVPSFPVDVNISPTFRF